MSVDEKHRQATLTEAGVDEAGKHAGPRESLRHRQHGIHPPCLSGTESAHPFKLDQYVVKDGEVIIVDEFTGRLMPGRRWRDGLHQAVEAKEGVKIEKETRHSPR